MEFMGEEDADYAIKIMNMIKVSELFSLMESELIEQKVILSVAYDGCDYHSLNQYPSIYPI